MGLVALQKLVDCDPHITPSTHTLPPPPHPPHASGAHPPNLLRGHPPHLHLSSPPPPPRLLELTSCIYCMFNLIVFNPHEGTPFPPSPPPAGCWSPPAASTACSTSLSSTPPTGPPSPPPLPPQAAGAHQPHLLHGQPHCLQPTRRDPLPPPRRLLELTSRIYCMVNLIVFNPHEGTPFRGSSRPAVTAFRSVLMQAGRICTVGGAG